MALSRTMRTTGTISTDNYDDKKIEDDVDEDNIDDNDGDRNLIK